MKWAYLSSLLVVLFALMPRPSDGQALPFVHITTEHQRVPLPSSSVLVGRQDSQGFLWLGFFSAGLGRYDGHSIERFGAADGLVDSTVREILEDGQGYLWVGTDSGLVVSDEPLAQTAEHPPFRPRFRTHVGGRALASHRVRHGCLTTSFDGSVWVVTPGDGLIRYERQGNDLQVTRIDLESVAGESPGTGLALIARQDEVWVAFQSGAVVVVRDGEKATLLPRDLWPPSPISAFYEDSNGTLWGGCRDGRVWRLDEAEGRPTLTTVSRQLREPISSILRTSQDELWAASLGDGLLRLDLSKASAGSGELVGQRRGLLSKTVWHLEEDQEDNLWLAHNAGLSKLRPNYHAFLHLTSRSLAGEPPLLPEPSVFAVLPDGEQTWVGTGGGLAVLRPGLGSAVLAPEDGLLSRSIYSLARYGESLWIGTPNGLNILAPVEREVLPGLDGRAPDTRVVKVHGDRYLLSDYRLGTIYATANVRGPQRADGTALESVWVAGTQGLAMATEKGWAQPTNAGLPSSGVTDLIQDALGHVWLGTTDAGVWRSRAPVLPNWWQESSPFFEPVWGIAEGAPSASVKNLLLHDGKLWIGTPNGLAALETEIVVDTPRLAHYLDAGEGLGGEQIFGMAVDERTGSLWVTQNAGLAEINPQQGTVRRRVSKLNGLIDDEAWSAYSLAVEDGILYQGTPKGLTLYEPGLDDGQHPGPRLAIRELRFQDSLTGDNEIFVRFAAVSFVNETQVRYRSRLLPYDEEWSEATAQADVRYTNLPAYFFPRRYTLEATAVNGEVVTREIRHVFKVRPAWWMTWWAVTLYTVGLALVFYRWYGWQTRKLKHRANDLEELFSKRTAAARTYVSELETLDQIVQAVHREVRLERVMEALLEQGVKLVPQASKGVFSIYDRSAGDFEIVAAHGWDLGPLTETHCSVEASMQLYAENAERLGEGIFLVRDPLARPGAEKMRHLPRPQALLSFEIKMVGDMEGFLVLDIFKDVEEVERRDVRTLSRYRRHAVSALEKAQTMSELEGKRHEAEQASRAKSAFLANMSHELRTPLNSIIGFSEILRDKLADGEPRHLKFAKNIHASGLHLLNLINEILDLSKVESGRVELQPEKVSLVHVVENVVAMMGTFAAKNDVTLRTELPENVPDLILDGPKLKQILYNLVSNAVKFSPDGGEVRTEAKLLAPHEVPAGVPVGETVFLAVHDQGIGIERDDQKRIFEEFQQVSTSIARKFSGTGLGLTLVRRYVELHQGKIEVESEPGKGSTFRVYLPVLELPGPD